MANINKEYFVPGNSPSSKNSRRLVKGGKFIASKQTMRWRKFTTDSFVEQAPYFRKALKGVSKPYRIGFFFIRDSKRKFDWVNPLQTIQDTMVFHGWIDDDNVAEIIPFPLQMLDNGELIASTDNIGVWYKVDKPNAGVIIKIL